MSPRQPTKARAANNLYGLWTLIIDGLTDLPEHRGKIIQLLQAIQNLPLSNGREGEAQGKQIQLADLPNFGHLWFDLKIPNNWRSAIRKWAPEQREGVRQDYIKQATIDAQLVAANVDGIPILWGLGCICDALDSLSKMTRCQTSRC